MSDPCKYEKELGSLLEAKEGFEKFMEEMRDNHLAHIYSSLTDIKDKISGRPTWAVLWMITTLTTLCGILLSKLLFP